METILWMLVLLMLCIQSVLLIACCAFLLRELKGVSTELPKVELNPFKGYQERKDKKEAEFEQSRIDTIMRNIENYDGTSNGQEDVPRG